LMIRIEYVYSYTNESVPILVGWFFTQKSFYLRDEWEKWKRAIPI